LIKLNNDRGAFMLPNKNKTLTVLLSTVFILTSCKDPAPPPQGPPEVGIYTAVTQAISMATMLSGRTSAYAVAEVRPQVGGIIQKRHFIEGSNVVAGQPLYQIESAAYRAAYESAKAALTKAEASALSTRALAERYKGLIAVQAVSKQEYDNAVATMKQNAAEVLASKAALENARINLAYTQVNAPISGRIGRSTVTQGALVTSNQSTALATIQQLDPMYVDVQQSSAEYLRLRQALQSGQLQSVSAKAAKVKLTLEDGSDYPLEGTLQFLDVNVEPSTSAVTLRAIFPNPDGLLLPGVFVRATLAEGVNNQAILLPQQGVMRDQKGAPYVFVVGNDNKVALRHLTVGKAIGNRWVVLDGIQAGDKVIIDGIQKVKPGIVVKTVPTQIADTSNAVITPLHKNPPLGANPTSSIQPSAASQAQTKQ
jgi:membrane fusion protein (multidrug efflux system)